ncbi:hypothetical protein ACRAWD_02335 [Caulobacter segnis]
MPILNDQTSCMIWIGHPALRDCHDLTEEQYRAALDTSLPVAN